MRKGQVDTGLKIDPLVTDEDRARYGEELAALAREPGWQRLLALVERRRQNIGNAALDDSPKMHRYWLGRRDEIDELMGEVMLLATESQAVESIIPEVENAFLGRRVPQAGPMIAADEDEPGEEEP